ncbi:FUSC family protein [Peterkaempfera bronchialis]|uniref:FUSC family protein n=1 Tax=Peterkaempfera bronchialis TaxID=2126346 RepID=UPI003C2E75B7
MVKLGSALSLRRPLDIWYKPGLSAVVAAAVPQLILLLAFDRLDLAAFTTAGAMCALYAHGLPYAARARTMSWVGAGMIAGAGLGLVAGALIHSAAALILVISLIAAIQKLVCDATRIGPPGNVVFTFITAGFAFQAVPLGAVPFHCGLVVLGAALAWVVTMAPAVVRPRGPQRIAVARALEAGARHLAARPEERARTRHATASAINDAWHTLFLVPDRDPAKEASRAHLEQLLVHAESVLAHTPVRADSAPDPRGLRRLARALRRNRPLPELPPGPAGRRELAGIAAERATQRYPGPGTRRGLRLVVDAFRPGSPLLPIGARLLIGATAAGWICLALGIGHPYWAVVTAASVFQANLSLSWSRALQRAVGNFLGLACFTVLLPVTRSGDFGLLAVLWLCVIGAEALVSRNYWAGTVCVTQQALLLTEFGGYRPALPMITDRWICTCIGVVVGVAVTMAVGNWRAAGRMEAALRQVQQAQAAAEHALRTPALLGGGLPEASWARDRLSDALVELRDATEVASGEWWQRVLPSERITEAERSGHQALASLVRRLAAARPAVAA